MKHIGFKRTLWAVPFFLVSLAPPSVARADTVQVLSVLSCGPLSTNPKKRPAYTSNFLLTYSGGKLTGVREITRQKNPAREVYTGSINPDGTIQIDVRGARLHVRGAWEAKYSGRLSDTGVTTVTGVVHGLTGRGKRSCKISFIETGAELRSMLGSKAPSSEMASSDVTKKLQTKLNDLRKEQEDTTKQLKEAQQAAEKASSDVTNKLQAKLNDLRKEQEDTTKQLKEAQQAAEKASSDVTNKLQAKLNDLRKEQEDTTKQLKEAQQAAEKASSDVTNKLQAKLNDLRKEQEGTTKQLKEAQQAAEKVSSGVTNKLQAELSNLRKKQEDTAKQLKEAQQRLEQQQSNAQQNKTSVTQLQADIQQLEQKRANTEKQLQASQRRLGEQQASTEKKVATVGKFLGGIVLPAWENPRDWMMRVAAIPVQQQQFCRIVDQFYDDLAKVYQVHNDIKKNTLYRDRQKDMAALLPRGEFDNWVVQIKEVSQAPDGSAAVMLQPPCRAMLGSDACQRNGSKIRATIPVSSPLYRELSRVNAGDFVVVSGKILYAESEDHDQPLPTYALYQAGSHCSAADGSKEEDVFVTEIRYLVQLR